MHFVRSTQKLAAWQKAAACLISHAAATTATSTVFIWIWIKFRVTTGRNSKAVSVILLVDVVTMMRNGEGGVDAASLRCAPCIQCSTKITWTLAVFFALAGWPRFPPRCAPYFGHLNFGSAAIPLDIVV